MTIDSEIEAAKDKLRELNQKHFRRSEKPWLFNGNDPMGALRGYNALPQAEERAIGQLADEIARLYMAKSLLGANALCSFNARRIETRGDW